MTRERNSPICRKSQFVTTFNPILHYVYNIANDINYTHIRFHISCTSINHSETTGTWEMFNHNTIHIYLNAFQSQHVFFSTKSHNFDIKQLFIGFHSVGTAHCFSLQEISLNSRSLIVPLTSTSTEVLKILSDMRSNSVKILKP